MPDQKTTASKSQIERFKETARALGCDEDEAAFDEKLKVIARPASGRKADSKSMPSSSKRERR